MVLLENDIAHGHPPATLCLILSTLLFDIIHPLLFDSGLETITLFGDSIRNKVRTLV